MLTTVCKRATKMKYLKTKCNRIVDNEISAVTYTETITLTVLKSNYLANQTRGVTFFNTAGRFRFSKPHGDAKWVQIQKKIRGALRSTGKNS